MGADELDPVSYPTVGTKDVGTMEATASLHADSLLQLIGFPSREGVDPFVSLRLGPHLTLIVHQVEAAARLARLAEDAGRELRRLGVRSESEHDPFWWLGEEELVGEEP